jgi:predicted lipoprotein with Yx(FWY)xxD motif
VFPERWRLVVATRARENPVAMRIAVIASVSLVILGGAVAWVVVMATDSGNGTVAPQLVSGHSLVVQIEGSNGVSTCHANQPPVPITSGQESAGTYLLLRAHSGRMLAAPKRLKMESCLTTVTFTTGFESGAFMVSDGDNGETWGPFEARTLAAKHWKLFLKMHS